MKAIYFCDCMGDQEYELQLITDQLREAGITIPVTSTDIPPGEDEHFDIMFFDWGGMSMGNSMLEHFCEHWIEDARNKPDRIFIMTSIFTQYAMEDLRGYSQREIEEFPKNIFMNLESSIPYLKEIIKEEKI